jgi:hypothetical protein
MLEQLRSEMLAWEDALRASDAGDFRGSLHLFEVRDVVLLPPRAY